MSERSWPKTQKDKEFVMKRMFWLSVTALLLVGGLTGCVTEAEKIRREEAEKAREIARQEEFAAKEAKQNPNHLDRSLYKRISVEDFSFDMVAGKLATGSKVVFKSSF
jgi:hypothetical protein